MTRHGCIMDMDSENALIVRIRPVKLLVLDVDGVMTDGSIIYTDEGVEIKAFNVRGLGTA